MKHIDKYTIISILSSFLLFSCSEGLEIKSGSMILSVDKDMHMMVELTGNDAPLTEKSQTEYIELEEGTVSDFKLKSRDTRVVGDTTVYTLIGEASMPFGGTIKKIQTISVDRRFPGMAVTEVKYVNESSRDLHVVKWVNHAFRVIDNEDTPAFWSFQGQSTIERADWILPVDSTFYQRNYMGMNDSDYGGGIPVTCLWRRDQGIAVGHVELSPRLVSFPVKKSKYDNYAEVAVESAGESVVAFTQGDTISTVRTFVSVYEGDCFAPLRQFSEYMQVSGLVMPESEPAAFEPMWCAWGYEREATFAEILGTLPKVKELGIKWATVDDGYQIAEGDWELDTKRFPGGDRDMVDLVKKMKAYGLKVQLWWAPLAADPGTKVLKENPDFITLSKQQTPHYITWWDSYYLSPVDSGVVSYSRDLVDRFMKKYDFDGLKLDGQHLNSVHPDYNWKHHPECPQYSYEQLPGFFKMIYDESRSINPHAVIQNCPCGCCMSFYNLPYTNQTVASDPTSSWQVRLKGYVYKALVPRTAYFGDHVELSDHGDDFASSFGIGAVLGTKFTWPKNNPKVKADYRLTPEKEVIWKKWFSLYNEKMLSTGEYVNGLYDIGYSRPEAHVIRKDGTLYYAFYASSFDGDILVKGLEEGKKYELYDYFNEVSLGEVEGPEARLHCKFERALLFQANEVKK